jgi:uncharacterized protein
VHSCLYHGSVRHKRHGPAAHAFSYQLALLYLDLEEVETVFAGRWLWSAGRKRAPVHWRREDHYGAPERDLRDCIRELVRAQADIEVRGPIRLLTHPRHFGYGFNPVSFYYCFDATGAKVEAIVAEITNTPWGERHCYVLPAASSRSADSHLRFRFGKDFHVSPFLPMDHDYDWRFSVPDTRLAVHMCNQSAGAVVFNATLALERKPITGASLAAALGRFPFMTIKVTTAIYWQALRLWLKRAPVFTHPDKTGAGHRSRAGRIDNNEPAATP